jgi:hypothetical protein
MASKREIDVDINVESNLDGSIAQLKELKKQLKNVAAGSDEFKKLYNEIDDLEDKIKGAKKGSADWIDTLESAGGPLGMLGSTLNKLKVSTTSFGAALKATGIGLVVAAIGGLVAAFSKTEGSMKKLEPLFIGLEKIFGGLVQAFQPVLDAFLEMAMTVLPYITEGIKIFYGSLVSLFTLIKEAASGVGDILAGIFTLDGDRITKGYNQLAGSWDKTLERYDQFSKDFDKGAAKQTATEKKNAGDSLKIAQDRLEAQRKIDEAQLQLQKEKALATATTEQDRLRIEQEFAQKSYDLSVKNNKQKLALLKGGSEEEKNARKDLQAELIKLEADRIKQVAEFTAKQKEIDQKDTDKRLEAVKVAGETAIAYETFVLEKKKQLYGEASDVAIAQAQKVIDARKTANQNEIEALQGIVEMGGKLTEEQTKRYDFLNEERKKFVADQLQQDITLIKFNADKNAKLNAQDAEQLKKISENEQLIFSVRISAVSKLITEAENEKAIKLAALEEEKLRRQQDGEDEVALAQNIADRKKLIEQGYTDTIGPLVLQKKDLVVRSNQEEFNSFLQLGSAISTASQLFNESSNAARAFAAVQDLVNIAQQANIVITNLQALGILSKASAEGVNTVATMGSATAEGVKSGAKLPFPLNIVAIASVVGAIISIFATIKKLFSPSKAPISGSLSTPTTTTTAPQTPAPINVVATRASGGMVSGEGTSTSDSILARVSNGEYVMNARSTSAFLPLLESMNNAGNQPQFATGGLYSSQSNSNMTLGDAISKSLTDRPIKTYVVANNMSNQQQLDRVIKSRSLI